MRKQLVLVVDDEAPIQRFLRAELEAQGFRVLLAGNGVDALQHLEDDRPDLVLLDVMMPEMDGFETLRRLRQHSPVPVIMLTARGSDTDKVRGLQSGADDYITKPFNPEELSARIGAVLRRSQAHVGGPRVLDYRDDAVTIDLDRRAVTVRGDEVRLSKTEWHLLEELASHAGRVMLHRELLARIWGAEYVDDVHYLRIWVSRLRAKLERDPSAPALIHTMPGLGYRLEPPA
ncbi:MAG: response regulator transcription factor [Chloroflexi bacterium]|nr:response regulator transcription factor [Chloroflexota bacterium]